MTPVAFIRHRAALAIAAAMLVAACSLNPPHFTLDAPPTAAATSAITP